MTMRKYIVTVHSDGTLSSVEYEEPSSYPNIYGPKPGELMQAGYNEALEDVKSLLELDKIRWQRRAAQLDIGFHQSGMCSARAIECERLKTAVSKLYKK